MTDLELIEIIQKLNTFTNKELTVFAEITIHDGLRKYARDLILTRMKEETGRIAERLNQRKQEFQKQIMEDDANYQKLMNKVNISSLD